MLPFSQICVPPINPAIADSTVIASWIIFFHTLLFIVTFQQFMKVEIRLPDFDKRKQKLGVRIQNLPEEPAHFALQ